MENKITSYTAANSLPIKIFKNETLIHNLCSKYIPPIHVQFIPTNKCNMNCNFCSCRNRNKSDELSLQQISQLCKNLKTLGCKSVTITGGGEPLMHPNIQNILELFTNNHIKIGLVTNGLLLNKLTSIDLKKIKWCRISCSDERNFKSLDAIIEKAVNNDNNIDWAFSYVIGDNFNPDNLNNYIKFANEHNFTHVRIVSDLCNLSGCPDMELIKSQVTENDNKVIYQGRKFFEPGQQNCWISLLKPLIGADGFIYPCCGVQYAHLIEDLDNPKTMQMGKIENINELYKTQKPFNGSNCYRCYYKNYNDILSQMITPTDHVEFV